MTVRRTSRVVGLLLAVALVSAPGCRGGAAGGPEPGARPLPPPVMVRPEPDGVTLADPAFKALPGARADFGRLGGAVYQIEVPDRWNGRLLLFMHGFEEFASEAHVSAPDERRYLIAQGYAWGASSFSSTSLIPGRSADETAALWDFFARKYGRPARSYISGLSMGGMATHIAAERYANRFDGALALCGTAGQTPAVRSGADYFVAGAFAAGVTQAEFDATTDIGRLVRDRILPALRDPRATDRFERILVDLTGGPREFDREGIRLEEETNWRRTTLLVVAHIAPNRDTRYRLGPRSPVTSEHFNRAVIRLPLDQALLRTFVQGNDTTGNLQMPLLSLHTTGDGQVPVEQARILQRNVEAAGTDDLLVQRILRDPGHCGFTTTELEASLDALVAWVERGVVPKGNDVLVRDLRRLRPRFELLPREGTREADAVPGARERVIVRGTANLNGASFDSRFLGAVVRTGGLVTPCQLALSSVSNGRYEITVLGEAESSGCGAVGSDVVLWAFADGKITFSRDVVPWPRNRRATFDATFSTASPGGAVPSRMEFSGEVDDRDGRPVTPGTKIEAYIGGTRCGVASTRRTGSFSGYILSVVGPDAIPGCARGGTIRFRIDGRPALDTAVHEPGSGATLDLTRA
jgi:hypothetical protein